MNVFNPIYCLFRFPFGFPRPAPRTASVRALRAPDAEHATQRRAAVAGAGEPAAVDVARAGLLPGRALGGGAPPRGEHPPRYLLEH